jgi:hypothetical protein
VLVLGVVAVCVPSARAGVSIDIKIDVAETAKVVRDWWTTHSQQQKQAVPVNELLKELNILVALRELLALVRAVCSGSR